MAIRYLSSWLVVALVHGTIGAPSDTLSTSGSRASPSAPQVHVDTLFKPPACLRTSQTNDRLAVTYVGTLTDNGTRFDASEDPNNPFFFVLGVGQVIKGWDQGLLGVCEGEKRRLQIPSELAYGHGGAGDDIPPDASLTFHVELIQIANRKYDSKPSNELEIQTTLQPATCPRKSKQGDQLAMIYVGTFKSDGRQFDAATTPDKPFEFKLGAGEVIRVS